MRLLLEVYNGAISEARGVADEQNGLVERRELRLDKDALPPQATEQFHLPDGDYYVLAWADYAHKDRLQPYAYIADTLTNVRSNLKGYPENTLYRSAVAGQESFVVDLDLGQDGYPSLKADRYTSPRVRFRF